MCFLCMYVCMYVCMYQNSKITGSPYSASKKLARLIRISENCLQKFADDLVDAIHVYIQAYIHT